MQEIAWQIGTNCIKLHYPLFLMHTDTSPEKHRKAPCSPSSMAFLHPPISSHLLATGYWVHQKAGWRKAARALEWSSSLSSPSDLVQTATQASWGKLSKEYVVSWHFWKWRLYCRRAKTKKGRPLHKMNCVCTKWIKMITKVYERRCKWIPRIHRLFYDVVWLGKAFVQAWCASNMQSCTGMKVHMEGSKQQDYYVWIGVSNTTWFKGDQKISKRREFSKCFICTIPQQDQTCETWS